jgi:membrane associated rhomboid family serine protease
MLFLPIRTDSPVRRLPLANYALIALNVLAYLSTNLLVDLAGGAEWNPKGRLALDPRNLELAQFFTYLFVHDGLLHLLGNLLFLWLFGNSVNCKMGQAAYLLFYLASGVFAGVGFAVGGTSPCVGSSGAIAGITTAYLVLFPRAYVTVLYWIWFYLGTTHVQAMWLIVLKVILWDNIIAPGLEAGPGMVQVAYSAHIAGYLFGFVTCGLLLLLRALPRDQYDILALARRAYQRQQFRAAMANPETAARAAYGRVARLEAGEEPPAAPPDDITRLRGEIAELLSSRDYAAAAERYEALVARDPKQCLSRRHMLDIANQLMVMDKYPQAAAAYEKYLQAYPAEGDALQIKLLLGIIYAKYLQQYEAAQKYLRDCLSRLTNPDQVRQAHHWLDTVTAALGGGPSTA